jgi:2-keto-4-pentenoate hydratase/2-oxohepta-3-ene-1,7-dioic acid hydratase in catechol pathway
MKYASYEHENEVGFGAVTGDRVAPLASGSCRTLREAIAQWGMQELAERASRARSGLPLGSVQLRQPITDPDKILCVGLNFFAHAEEAGLSIPKFPSVFARFPGSQVAHGQAAVLPRWSDQFDFEAELAVIIGRRTSQVMEAQAMDAVAGYSCFAENSVRNWQKHTTQVTPGKNFHRSGAFGPWLVSADEVGDPARLEVIGRLNGQQVQRDRIANLIFPISRLIAYISSFAVLEPGDVIVTGTPAGVGMARKPPLYMRAGDVFEVEIPRVGTLRHTVIEQNPMDIAQETQHG